MQYPNFLKTRALRQHLSHENDPSIYETGKDFTEYIEMLLKNNNYQVYTEKEMEKLAEQYPTPKNLEEHLIFNKYITGHIENSETMLGVKYYIVNSETLSSPNL